jgi:hypothetical protein
MSSILDNNPSYNFESTQYLVLVAIGVVEEKHNNHCLKT